jgi:hypothetical protein
VATCGHLNTVVGDAVRKIREQAGHLRTTAAQYVDMDKNAQTQVTVK